jgi:hypothetical protein
MGYNRGMSTELCKFAGGTCKLCGDSDVCTREPPVDMGVAKRFIEDHRTEFPIPTCKYFESRWGKTLNAVSCLVSGGTNIWNGLSRGGDIILRVYPGVTLDPSQWFQGGCEPVHTTLFEKQRQRINTVEPLFIGSTNGLVLCNGMPFAVNTTGAKPDITRPVVPSQRQKLLDEVLDFEAKVGQIYNSR